jgi:hypothetical protein
MKEIKSVRIRKRHINTGTLDIKVTLSENKNTFGSDDRILVGTNNDRVIWLQTTYKKSGLYKDFTDDQFIDNFILVNSKIDGGGSIYDIIQDPWEIKTPKWRSYGFDPYYLNNGAYILISWLNGDTTAGGKKYSDSNGVELTDSEKGFITKTATISFEGEKVMSLNKNGIFEYGFNSQEFSGLINDVDIIKLIITKWSAIIPNYSELALCSPDNESCSIIEYKNPLKPITSNPVTIKSTSNEIEKIKMTVVLPPDQIKVKSDITSFIVYIGNIQENLENNIDQDDYIYSDSGINEYTESEFIGNDEAKWEPLNEVDDDTYDPDDKGGDEVFEPSSYVPATQTQKDFIKTAIKATLSKGEQHGKCARFTFNHVNNYVRLLQGKEVEKGAVHNAGGNANNSGYHKNLQNMGYNIVASETINKIDLISKITNGLWSVGDVVVYWCTDGPVGSSHVKYGHTQIFTNGFHNNSDYRWSTDNENNYRSSFVYKNKSGNTYKFIHFQAPKTKRIEEVL